MSFLAWILAGAVLAAMCVSLVRGRAVEVRVWTLGLVVAALVYPVLAIAGGVSAAAGREIVGALPWVGAALASRRVGLLLLAVAWPLHGVWDLLPVMRPWMPDFYPPFCVGFDLVAGLRLMWMRHSP